MKKSPFLLLFSVLFIFSAISSSLADEWVQSNPWYSPIHFIEFHSADSTLRYAYQTTLWRTDDSGENWQKLDVGYPENAAGVPELFYDRNDSDRLWMLAGSFFYSDNRGETWEEHARGLPIIEGFEVYQGTEHQSLFYAFVFDPENNDWNLYRSRSGGQYWEERSAVIHLSNLGVNPINDRHIMYFDSHMGRTIYFKESYDGGATWDSTRIYNSRKSTLLGINPQNPEQLLVLQRYTYYNDIHPNRALRVIFTSDLLESETRIINSNGIFWGSLDIPLSILSDGTLLIAPMGGSRSLHRYLGWEEEPERIETEFLLSDFDLGNTWFNLNDISVNPENPRNYYLTLNFPESCVYMINDGEVVLPQELNFDTEVPEDGFAIPSTEELVRVYPNPTNSEVIVQLPQSFGRRVTIRLYNTLGQEVLTEQFSNENAGAGEFRIAIAEQQLPNGIYILQADNGSETISRKISLLK
ncbi:T9SS type A sorting domain-containing protein [bacterium]|nr:T9SS type A sorting domain-containing protein [bacterium]